MTEQGEKEMPTIMAARHNADELMSRYRIKSSEALDMNAQICGWESWEHMSEDLRGNKHYPLSSYKERLIAVELGLNLLSGQGEVMRREDNLIHHTLGNVLNIEGSSSDLWHGRTAQWVEACLSASLMLHEVRGVSMSADSLYQSFSLQNFCLLVRAVKHGEISGEPAEILLRQADALPGFSVSHAVRYEEQPQRTKEAAGFASMIVTKKLYHIISEGRAMTDDMIKAVDF